MLAEELARGVDLAAILVGIAPAADGIEILQRKPQRVELRMATGAIGTFAVRGKALTQGEVFLRCLRLLQRRYIGGGRLGRRIKHHAGYPSASRDRLGLVRARSHREHCRRGHHPTLPPVGHRLLFELHGHRTTHLAGRVFAVPLAQTTGAEGVI